MTNANLKATCSFFLLVFSKQFIKVNSLLEDIYYPAPILLWLLSLVFTVLTLSPKAYAININSSRDSKERFKEIVAKKHGMLKWSEGFLIVSFIALLVAVAHYLLVVPKV